MGKYLFILMVALFLETFGVILLSKGLKEIGPTSQMSIKGISQTVGKGVTNRKIILGVLMEAIFFGALLYLLANKDVSFVWPLTALSMVFTTLAAFFYLNEQVDGLRWAGVLLIVLGALLVSWSEKNKKPPDPSSLTDSTTNQAK